MLTSPKLEIHIGYVYGMNQAPAHASHYTPKFVPGARLPHAWIKIKGPTTLPPLDVSYIKEFSEQDVKSRQFSTLDLCSYDRFTLLVGSREKWAQRFQTLEAAMTQYGIRVGLVVAHHDFDFVYERQEQLFAVEGNLSSGFGLLVRPDQHLLRLVQPMDSVASIAKSLVEHQGFLFQDE